MPRSRNYLLAAGALVSSLTMALGGSPGGRHSAHQGQPDRRDGEQPGQSEGHRVLPLDGPFTLWECSSKDWVVPASPCLTSNRVHVHTNAKGAFRATMTRADLSRGQSPRPDPQDVLKSESPFRVGSTP